MGCDSVYPDRPQANATVFAKSYIVFKKEFGRMRIINNFSDELSATQFTERLAKCDPYKHFYIIEGLVIWGEYDNE